MPIRYLVLILLGLPLYAAAQTDSLLQSASWLEEGTDYRLVLTPDETFQQDYGRADRRAGRYLLGRYTTDDDSQELTLSVDYFLGKSRIPGRYRRGQDFYLPYRIDTLTADRLVLVDLISKEVRRFTATPPEIEDDPVQRRTPLPELSELKLPDGWGG
ncbi:hypothetical protein LEM8419_03183 [Neolewinella maritima]|uniref:Uncharacterized protein n=1 Tax=Neolewinella maritima TaxID=1383882 RepID=A0ABM9B4W8_9BACT|nr:hypothetical protein [Neolewinella maritima]CAH1002264.1 hypothetical protein LEM8419_03183 [Neolewinella maritima]